MCSPNYGGSPSSIEEAKEAVGTALDNLVEAYFEAIKDAADNGDIDEIESLIEETRDAVDKRQQFS